MHTVQIQLNDDLYEHLSSGNIDIQTKVKEYLLGLVKHTSYPTISTEEAKTRVSEAVNRYESGSGSYTPFDENYTKEMNEYIGKL